MLSVCLFSRAANRSSSPQTSYWWIVGLVVAVTVLALTAMLVYLKLRGETTGRLWASVWMRYSQSPVWVCVSGNKGKSSSRYPEEETELNSVRGTAEETGKYVGWKYSHMSTRWSHCVFLAEFDLQQQPEKDLRGKKKKKLLLFAFFFNNNLDHWPLDLNQYQKIFLLYEAIKKFRRLTACVKDVLNWLRFPLRDSNEQNKFQLNFSIKKKKVL